MRTAEEIRREIAELRESIDEAKWHKQHNLLPLDRIGELDCQETAEWLRKAHAHAEAVIVEAAEKIAELNDELFEIGWLSELAAGKAPMPEDTDGMFAELCAAIDDMCATEFEL